jgi:DNA-binding IscR family transcriptional regulator
MWRELGDEIADVFRQTTIQDLCQRAEAMTIQPQCESSLGYYI